MLEINKEIYKGVLFIRLKGILTKDTIDVLNNEVTNLVIDNGITNIVFNLSKLTKIDIKGINALFKNYEINTQNKGRTCLCGLSNTDTSFKIKNSRLLNYMYEASDELSALNIINL